MTRMCSIYVRMVLGLRKQNYDLHLIFHYMLVLVITLWMYYCLFTSMWLLQETLHVHNEKKTSSNDSYDALEAATGASKGDETRTDDKGRKPSSNESLLKNWPLMSSIVVYCIFSLHDMAYTEVFIPLIPINPLL